MWRGDLWRGDLGGGGTYVEVPQGHGRASHYPMAALLFPLLLPIHTGSSTLITYFGRFYPMLVPFVRPASFLHLLLCFSHAFCQFKMTKSRQLTKNNCSSDCEDDSKASGSIITARLCTDRYRINPGGHCLFHSRPYLCSSPLGYGGTKATY